MFRFIIDAAALIGLGALLLTGVVTYPDLHPGVLAGLAVLAPYLVISGHRDRSPRLAASPARPTREREHV